MPLREISNCGAHGADDHQSTSCDCRVSLFADISDAWGLNTLAFVALRSIPRVVAAAEQASLRDTAKALHALPRIVTCPARSSSPSGTRSAANGRSSSGTAPPTSAV
jgi:hypothetical protein